MSKGGNNPRGRSSAASKPYDVSNSFVKRMASRVTDLLPQPTSWFSRWMSPASVSNHTASTSRIPATSRADLNLVSDDDVDHVPAKRARTNQYPAPSPAPASVNQHNFLNNDIYDPEELSPIAVRAERVEPAAIPGPSSARPEFIASTPAVTAQQQQTSTKVNGDDCSETSESTSGCSSLVPQAQSTIRSLGGSRFANSFSQAMNVDSLHRRRPSFNTTTFTSPLRSSMRDRLGSSPFYSGRTMYGGSAQAYVSMVPTTQRRVRPTVKPAPASQQSQPLSSTAKCILDALEQLSTPVMDARRIPVNSGTKRKLEGTQRYAELSIPSTPDLLRVKRRERLQQSTSAARQTATTPIISTPSLAPPREYTLRKEDEVDKKHTGKVKTKEVVDQESVVEVKLPSVSLTLDKLPKIDISVPPPTPVVSVGKPKPAPKPTSCSTTTSVKFVFPKPTIVPVTFSCSVNVPTSTFSFSPPLSVSDSSSVSPVSEVNSRTSSASPKRQKSIDIKSAVTTLNSLTSSSVQASECKVCKAKLNKPSAPCSSCKTAEKPKSDFADLMKKQTGGTWECSVCMIRNKNEASRCVACETLKPAPKPAVEAAKPTLPVVSTTTTGFGDKFKKPTGSWECDPCMLRNEPSSTKCVACETPKPSKLPSVPLPSGTGFGDLFKKPVGSWTCKECMVTNDSEKVKCVACETVKPGSTAPKTKESSAPKFSFGIPSSSLSTPSSNTTFSFGINNVDQSKPTTVPSNITVSKDNSQASEAPQTFQFGIPKSSKVESDSSTEVSSSSSTKPMFQFGTSSATTSVDTKISFGMPSTTTKPTIVDNVFGSANKRKMEEETKSEPVKLAFSSSSKPTPVVVVSVNSETESSRLTNDVSETTNPVKSSSTPAPIFSFGSSTTQSLGDKSISNPQVKPFQSSFMFEAKQGSNFPSSTTNTLSTSVSSNVFKFGDTKTVPSGSTAPSVSAVSSQASVASAVTKSNNIFSFGSSATTEKKDISFGTTKATENQSAQAQENKPAFAFGTTTTPAFSNTSATPSFGATGAFSIKKEESSPFAPQTTTTNMFGLTQAPIVTPSSTFPAFGQNNAFTTATQENKPAPGLFAFGSAASKETTSTPAGGFSFPSEPVVEKPAAPVFNFGGVAQANSAPHMFNSTPPSTFNLEPKSFGGGVATTPSPFAVNNDVQASVFGAATPQPAAPVFNFGSQQAPAPAAPMFNFSSNQQGTPAASTTFQFGASNSVPAQPTFDPTAKPTFNFSQGSSTQFTAVPVANTTGPVGPVRKIRKAVRRTNVPGRQ